MKYYPLTVLSILSISTCCLGASSLIRLPPFPLVERKGSYDVEIKRTEAFNGKAFPSVEGSFHVDAADASIRVVTKRLTFSPLSPPEYQSEKIYSKRDGSLMSIETETGTEPSRLVYMQHVDDEPAFYGGYHGVSVINGCFWNLEGSLWGVIGRNAEAVAGNKHVLPQGVEVRLLKHDGYWLLRRVSIHLHKNQKQLYSPKFYDLKTPSTNPLSSSEELDCEYGAEDREQKYRYKLSCKYEKDQIAVVQMEIAVQNYRPDVAVPPLSDEGVYTPTIVAIPNGFRVGVVNEGVIEHMWQDGRIIKKVDRKAVGTANLASFRHDARSRLLWGIFSLASLILIIAVWIWLHRRAKGSS